MTRYQTISLGMLSDIVADEAVEEHLPYSDDSPVWKLIERLRDSVDEVVRDAEKFCQRSVLLGRVLPVFPSDPPSQLSSTALPDSQEVIAERLNRQLRL